MHGKHRTPPQGFELFKTERKPEILNSTRNLKNEEPCNLNENISTLPQIKKLLIPKIKIEQDIYEEIPTSLKDLKSYRRENNMVTKERLKKIRDDLNKPIANNHTQIER